MSVVLSQETILPEITLDDALLESVQTFRNGCNYRLLVEKNKGHFLARGCYGVHVNLVQGVDKIFLDWFEDQGKPKIRLEGLVEIDTIVELMRRKPCPVCGAPLFKAEPQLTQNPDK